MQKINNNLGNIPFGRDVPAMITEGLATNQEAEKSQDILDSLQNIKDSCEKYTDKLIQIIDQYLQYKTVYNNLPLAFGSSNSETKSKGLLGFGGFLGL